MNTITPSRVLGYAPDDKRFSVDRHTNTVFPITRFSSREEVERRREELRFSLRMAAGLYPWPEKTPLNTRFEDVGDYDGYSVKKIMFESRPGFWSTGNLYLPNPQKAEKMPAILNVIGHWDDQRLTRLDTADYPAQLANFARMGFVCLVTDMIGMVDSRQISHEYGGEKEQEQWLSNGLGVQLWNNIRALDVLCALPYVDADRIGMTGASGGGSQTLFLSLVDERIRAAAPINMISLCMQGGCRCENAPGLRRHTDNTEMCAMLAPRPLFLAGSTGDWTKYLETAELPGVLEAYRQYGAEDMVEHFYQDAPHQYNEKTRHKVYSFFARHLLGVDPHWTEQEIVTGDLQDMTWFRGNGHAPGVEGDGEFFSAHKAERERSISALSKEEKRKMLSWMADIGCMTTHVIPLSREKTEEYCTESFILTGENGETLPGIRLTPANWDGARVVLALGKDGTACLSDPEIRKLLTDGCTVIAGDVFGTGELSVSRTVGGSAGDNRYFTAFNATDDMLRVSDTVRWIAYAGSCADAGADAPIVSLWADGAPARAAACALALSRDTNVRDALLEDAALTAEEDFFIPGLASLGGIEGCLAMAGETVNVKRF
ncbi:MAG: acetylxylan esterase [Clostridia bacterium]|nr:acetylxylan esterase [Clostridia bacterium]